MISMSRAAWSVKQHSPDLALHQPTAGAVTPAIEPLADQRSGPEIAPNVAIAF